MEGSGTRVQDEARTAGCQEKSHPAREAKPRSVFHFFPQSIECTAGSREGWERKRRAVG